MTAEENGWYVFTVPGATFANVIFTNGTGSQTVDLSRSSEGWFVPTGTAGGKITGTWYSSNPDEGGTVTTTIRVHYNTASGQSMYIRGNVPPLSWDQGVPMTLTPENVWVYTTTAIPAGSQFEFKPLINDNIWSKGSNYEGTGGQTVTITPTF
ncbi:MAG TPA: starch-binding protein [Firmicutes bacterium]|nr:starch-binding protein [Bacillota bacterium]